VARRKRVMHKSPRQIKKREDGKMRLISLGRDIILRRPKSTSKTIGNQDGKYLTDKQANATNAAFY
jgi:hypothetical protein